MVATRRGRAYVRSIPADRLLLETDAPPAPPSKDASDSGKSGLPVAGGAPYAVGDLVASLESAGEAIERERQEKLFNRIAETSSQMLML